MHRGSRNRSERYGRKRQALETAVGVLTRSASKREPKSSTRTRAQSRASHTGSTVGAGTESAAALTASRQPSRRTVMSDLKKAHQELATRKPKSKAEIEAARKKQKQKPPAAPTPAPQSTSAPGPDLPIPGIDDTNGTNNKKKNKACKGLHALPRWKKAKPRRSGSERVSHSVPILPLSEPELAVLETDWTTEGKPRIFRVESSDMDPVALMAQAGEGHAYAWMVVAAGASVGIYHFTTLYPCTEGEKILVNVCDLTLLSGIGPYFVSRLLESGVLCLAVLMKKILSLPVEDVGPMLTKLLKNPKAGQEIVATKVVIDAQGRLSWPTARVSPFNALAMANILALLKYTHKRQTLGGQDGYGNLQRLADVLASEPTLFSRAYDYLFHPDNREHQLESVDAVLEYLQEEYDMTVDLSPSAPRIQRRPNTSTLSGIMPDLTVHQAAQLLLQGLAQCQPASSSASAAAAAAATATAAAHAAHTSLPPSSVTEVVGVGRDTRPNSRTSVTSSIASTSHSAATSAPSSRQRLELAQFSVDPNLLHAARAMKRRK